MSISRGFVYGVGLSGVYGAGAARPPAVLWVPAGSRSYRLRPIELYATSVKMKINKKHKRRIDAYSVERANSRPVGAKQPAPRCATLQGTDTKVEGKHARRHNSHTMVLRAAT